jgi:uncharacterized protein (DUF362 family)
MKGVTTSSELLKSCLEIIKDRADKVIIGELNGENHSFSADNSFKGYCMNEICCEIGVDFVNLSNLLSTFVEEKIQGKRVKVQLPKLLLNKVDCFISVILSNVSKNTTAWGSK